jgi:hypothetical protein
LSAIRILLLGIEKPPGAGASEGWVLV